MKKLMFIFMASVAMTFAACNHKAPVVCNVVTNDSDSVAVVDTTLVTDTIASDSVVAE